MSRGVGALPEVLKVGTNELEIIVFKMYSSLPDGTIEAQEYGINVAKVREIIPIPVLTKVPDMPEYAEALAHVRGQVIPIVDLGKWMKIDPPAQIQIKPKVVVLEMLAATIGMIVHDVERIRRIKWTQIQPPPEMLQAKHSGRVTGVTKLEEREDSPLLLILDLESVISEIGMLSAKKESAVGEIAHVTERKFKGTVLIADDSAVARRILKDILEGAGLHVIEAFDGSKALEMLNDFVLRAGDQPVTDYIQLIITDVEMPEMDGLTFTKNIKANDKLKNIPIIVNTSLSGDENKEKAKLVGADSYMVKFDSSVILTEVDRLLVKK
ncbi:MAG: chemotaxis protein [Dissulfurispiraceae bacterium]|nr:chemotaxis protein [Dissulfurispiraceae bacterium]